MDSKTTETKTPVASRSKISDISKTCENLNPNLSGPSPGLKKMSNSLRAKSGKVENGYGRVAHLVQAFERLLSITKYSDLKADNGSKKNKNERMKWALPGLEQPKVSEGLFV